MPASSPSPTSVTANLAALESDDDRRDGQLRRQALETDAFPQAAFRLTSPIELDTEPEDGASVSATATGELTLHGVTKTVEIPSRVAAPGMS